MILQPKMILEPVTSTPILKYAEKISKIDLDTERKPSDSSTYDTGSSCKLVNKSLIQENFNHSVLPCPGWGVRGRRLLKVNKKLTRSASRQRDVASSDKFSNTTVCRQVAPAGGNKYTHQQVRIR
jgi:hypothetical protein